MSVGSMSSFAAALGESAIAFDFAPAVTDFDARGSYRASDTDAEIAYPIFILRENGDIYHLVHRISQTRYSTCILSLFTPWVGGGPPCKSDKGDQCTF